VAAGKRIHLRQGVEMGRWSDPFLSAQIQNGPYGFGQAQNEFAQVESARVTGARRAGSTVPVAKGQLFLP